MRQAEKVRQGSRRVDQQIWMETFTLNKDNSNQISHLKKYGPFLGKVYVNNNFMPIYTSAIRGKNYFKCSILSSAKYF